jgi:hypothetical protein
VLAILLRINKPSETSDSHHEHDASQASAYRLPTVVDGDETQSNEYRNAPAPEMGFRAVFEAQLIRITVAEKYFGNRRVFRHDCYSVQWIKILVESFPDSTNSSFVSILVTGSPIRLGVSVLFGKLIFRVRN